eukprot:jgi/Orpsp1_1/1185851/evm.model.c7180000095621.2
MFTKGLHPELREKLAFVDPNPTSLNRLITNVLNTLTLKRINDDENDRKSNIIGFFISINNIQEVKAKVLVDSGADMNFIHPNFAKYTGINLQPIKEPFEVSGLGYGISKVKKETEKCMLRNKNHLEIAFSFGYCARHCNNGKRRRKHIKKNKSKEKAKEDIRYYKSRNSDSESEKKYYFKGRYVKTINDSDFDSDYESDINDSFMFDSDSEFSDSDDKCNKENT